jgi:L-lactate dehydrogenase (cytochrome)
MRVEHAVNVSDFREIARHKLPPFVFDLLDGAAGDELTMRANAAAFERVQFRPRPLVDVRNRDLSTTVFGEKISMPLMLAPTGAGRVAHRTAELSVARAAVGAGTIYMQSTVTSFQLEDVATAAAGPLWYQLYLPPTRDDTEAMVERVAKAGYRALAVTIDTPIFGSRERDSHHRFVDPWRIRPHLVGQAISRPRWALEFVRGNVGSSMRTKDGRRLSLSATQAQILASKWPVTWNDLEMLRELWKAPLLVKGIMRADECDRLLDYGVDGIIVSNHGGRQLDGLPGAIEVLPRVVEAVRGRASVFVDGGIRRGADVVKAVALGATACFVGRPYLYGLAAAGEAGVASVLGIFHREIDITLALLGCRNIEDIHPSLVAWIGAT